jgi:cysteine-rich repeat protein
MRKEVALSVSGIVIGLLILGLGVNYFVGESVMLAPMLKSAVSINTEETADIVLQPIDAFDEEGEKRRIEKILTSGESFSSTGKIEVLIFDDFENGRSDMGYLFKEEGKKEVRVHFKEKPRDDFSGKTLSVQGKTYGGEIVVESYEVISEEVGVAGGENPNLGEQRTVVVLVNFLDNSEEPTDVGGVENHMAVINDFFVENSYGQTWLNTNVYGWFTLNIDSTGCDYNSFKDEVLSNVDINNAVDWKKVDKLIIGFPSNEDCNWSGIAFIGRNTYQTPDGLATLGISLLNGIGGLSVSVTSHELGHNFGVWHASALECGDYSVGLEQHDGIGDCYTIEYGDYTDVMGSSVVYNGHFNTFHKDKIGWLSFDDIIRIEYGGAGTYDIGPLETEGPYPKEIIIPRNNMFGDFLYNYGIDFRRPNGFDSNLPNINGVFLRIDALSSGTDTQLIDASPNDGVHDSVLKVGETFTDPFGGLTISVVDVNDNYARVVIGNEGERQFFCVDNDDEDFPPGHASPSQSSLRKGGKDGTTFNPSDNRILWDYCDFNDASKINEAYCSETGDDVYSLESCGAGEECFSFSEIGIGDFCYTKRTCEDLDASSIPPTQSDSSIFERTFIESKIYSSPSKILEHSLFPDTCVDSNTLREYYCGVGDNFASANIQCPTGKICNNGKCESPPASCEDECVYDRREDNNEKGCNMVQRWSCGEANDGDSCYDKVYSWCPDGKFCYESNGGRSDMTICGKSGWKLNNGGDSVASASSEPLSVGVGESVIMNAQCEECKRETLEFVVKEGYFDEEIYRVSSTFDDFGNAEENWIAGIPFTEEIITSVPVYFESILVDGTVMEGDVMFVHTVCGNSVIGNGETCDDGNTIDGDGCSSQCTDTKYPVIDKVILSGNEVIEGQSLVTVGYKPTYRAEISENGKVNSFELTFSDRYSEEIAVQAELIETGEGKYAILYQPEEPLPSEIYTMTLTVQDLVGNSVSRTIEFRAWVDTSRPTPTGGGGGCFLAETRIETASGEKNIEDVEVGDIVLSYNEKSDKTEEGKVSEVFEHNVTDYLVINGNLRVTPNHPMYVNGEWIEIGEAVVGDTLKTSNGKMEIKTIELIEEKVEVYNLEVEENHNYFAEGYLAHNKETEKDVALSPVEGEVKFKDSDVGKIFEWFKGLF